MARPYWLTEGVPCYLGQVTNEFLAQNDNNLEKPLMVFHHHHHHHHHHHPIEKLGCNSHGAIFIMMMRPPSVLKKDWNVSLYDLYIMFADTASFTMWVIILWIIIEVWTKWPQFRREHFQMHFLKIIFVIWFQFHWRLFQRVQLSISQFWFRPSLSSEQAATDYTGPCDDYFFYPKWCH